MLLFLVDQGPETRSMTLLSIAIFVHLCCCSQRRAKVRYSPIAAAPASHAEVERLVDSRSVLKTIAVPSGRDKQQISCNSMLEYKPYMTPLDTVEDDSFRCGRSSCGALLLFSHFPLSCPIGSPPLSVYSARRNNYPRTESSGYSQRAKPHYLMYVQPYGSGSNNKAQ